jgi:peptidoglycan L-alanyl-D-glutamate endopeptidase CwlK
MRADQWEEEMSARLFTSDILFRQRILACAGFYNGPLNGKWNAPVDDAEEKFFSKAEDIKRNLGGFDQRTETNILTLLPAAQIKAREFMKAVAGEALTYRILSGTRTYAEQNILFNKRPRVTKARGGQSNHNFGIAWDIGIFENGKYYEGNTKKQDKAYVALGDLIKSKVEGLEWGGDWTSFVDKPHYQLSTRKSVAQVRALFEKGKPFI